MLKICGHLRLETHQQQFDNWILAGVSPRVMNGSGGFVQSILIIVHAPAYGNERMLSALRLATAIAGQESETVDLRLFMMSDAVTVGLPMQSSAEAGGGLQQMLEGLVKHGAQIRLCRTCAQTRGIADLVLIPGVTIGTLPELAEWTLSADKVITF